MKKNHRKAAPGRGVALVTASGLAVASLSLVAPHKAHAATTVSNGDIAYSDNGANSQDVFSIHPDGSGATDLTNSPSNEGNRQPGYSPDGTKIAYVTSLSSNSEIYSMSADGTNQTNLTNDPSADRDPNWSPAGTKIAFSSDRAGNNDIFTMNTDGSGQINLTSGATSNERFPVWSPNGLRIAYASDADGSIWVMNADGSGQTSLSITGFPLDWSPDGAKILGRVGDPTSSQLDDVFSINADGTGYSVILPCVNGSGVCASFAAYSPDGTKIAFTGVDFDAGVVVGIFTANTNGTGINLVTPSQSQFSTYFGGISWQPVITVVPDPPTPPPAPGTGAATGASSDAQADVATAATPAAELPQSGPGSMAGAYAGAVAIYGAYRLTRRQWDIRRRTRTIA